ncbi:MAG: CinA family nicotinamide mononucleotide deamidase-related protein [Planctomycetes bacterium]|nr:CinA family nicotinamide mononucleotide deamidase-related protein [Planctomycetota bacterium]
MSLDRAEIIAIGDELICGERIDTNSGWISRQLTELGIPVRFHTTVGDDLPRMVVAIRAAVQRADVIVISGGLGPTADDLTRDAVAEALDMPLVLDEELLRHIEKLFARRGRPMPERNRLQAMRPEGARPISNPHGTAPGIRVEHARAGQSPCLLFSLPGVPVELFEMWRETVAPSLAAAGGSGRLIRHREIKCFGVGESHLESMLPDLIVRGREPSVGITVHAATITLRITATGSTEAECQQAIEPVVDVIRDALGDLVFGEGDDELSDAVLCLLSSTDTTLATAECGTAGRLAHWLSEAAARCRNNRREQTPQSLVAAPYRGGMVVPDSRATRDQRAIRELVEMMATGCREQFGADFGLSIGPLAPEGEESSSPGEFFFALATARGVTLHSDRTAGHPAILQDRAAKQALDVVRKKLRAEVRNF